MRGRFARPNGTNKTSKRDNKKRNCEKSKRELINEIRQRSET